MTHPVAPYTSWFGVIGQTAEQSFNAKRRFAVRNPQKIARIDAKGARVVKNIGKTATNIGWAGELATIYLIWRNYANNPTLGNYARYFNACLITSLNAIPYFGPAISFTVGGWESSGGLDSFYNWLDQ